MNTLATGFETRRFRTINANGHVIAYDSEGAGWRYETLLEKEPETIEWIDTFEPGDSFWDIGANVGIYSLYAAARGISTLAFEPHFANYHQLCVTIELNGKQDLVTPLCLAFAETKSIGHLNLASLDIGTSMSNFGEALDFRGQPFDAAFRQGMIGYDIDSFIADFGLEVPTHLKIDVDGIELDIVRGARRTLADARLQSVSIELVETDEAQVAGVTAILEAAGLHFIHKKQNMNFATANTTDVKNFLFHRDPARLQQRMEAEEESAPVTIDALVKRIAARIAETPVDPDPCDHLFMQGMFPANVYEELLARLPADSVLDPIEHPDAIATDGRVTRYLLDLTRDSLARLDPEDQQFWLAMIEMFTAPEITQAILAKFEPELRTRFGDDLPQLVAVPVLYRDFPGYRIGVHPDTPKKIATLQFYLPADDSQMHLGTSFHRRANIGFEKVKTNPFTPNSAYAFVRTDESWHSVDEMGPDEAPRNTIALTFYIKGQEYRSQPRGEAADTPAAAPTHRTTEFYDAELSQALRALSASFTSREDVATLFRHGGTGVILGVADGALPEEILNRSQAAWLYGIDDWSDAGRYRDAIVRLSPHRERSALLRMPLDEALPLFDKHSLDFVYIDRAAAEGQIDSQTFQHWFQKLKSGGIMAGDDYRADWPAMMHAIDAFVAANELELHVIDDPQAGSNMHRSGWFAMKP